MCGNTEHGNTLHADKWHLRMQPGERNLPWGAVVPHRHRLDFLDDLQVLQQQVYM